jgi:hypothetical protein
MVPVTPGTKITGARVRAVEVACGWGCGAALQARKPRLRRRAGMRATALAAPGLQRNDIG